MVRTGQRVTGYIRCSTQEQADSGLGLAAQRRKLQQECTRRGLKLVGVFADEGHSGKTLDRPGLMRALDAIVAGDADVLMVTKLDRLSRRVVDYTQLIEWFQDARAGWIALDLDIDTTTTTGKMMAVVVMAMAELERDNTSERTKMALAARREQGSPISRPAVVDTPLAKRIARMRQKGATYQSIADKLNREGIPTLRGGTQWRVSSVQAAAGYRRGTRRRSATVLPEARKRRQTT